MDETELNAIRAARMKELQNGQGLASPDPQQEQKFSMLSQVLEPSARERLSRVRMVRPERAEQVEQYLIKMISVGSITRKIGEKDIVEILESVSRGDQKQSKIVFERRNEDEDDDDFFDWSEITT